jgi:hypothetical protein
LFDNANAVWSAARASRSAVGERTVVLFLDELEVSTEAS